MDKRQDNELRIAYLRPKEVIEKKKEKSLIYLPIGLIEWHGPHLPFGTDAFNAELCALKSAEQTGGVLLPTLYIGTERETPKEKVKNFGLNENTFIEGIDMPSLGYRSFYMREEVFALVIRNYIEMVIEHEYKVMYIINGHAALNQVDVIERLTLEFNAKQSTTRIMNALCWDKASLQKLGHSTIDETSYIKYFDPNLVDLSQLPPKGESIKYYKTGIAGPEAFSNNAPKDAVLPDSQDPRVGSTADRGEKLLNAAVKEIVDEVNKYL